MDRQTIIYTILGFVVVIIQQWRASVQNSTVVKEVTSNGGGSLKDEIVSLKNKALANSTATGIAAQRAEQIAAELREHRETLTRRLDENDRANERIFHAIAQVAEKAEAAKLGSTEAMAVLRGKKCPQCKFEFVQRDVTCDECVHRFQPKDEPDPGSGGMVRT